MDWLIIVTLLLLCFAVAGLRGAPWLPTRRVDVDALLDDVDIKSGQLFLELGCGDGRVVAAAAKRGARAIGYEINPLLWLIASVRCLPQYPRAKIRLGNFWSVNLAQADVVMIFLIDRFMARFETKAKQQMRPGSKLVSYVFRLPKKRPLRSGNRWFIYRY